MKSEELTDELATEKTELVVRVPERHYAPARRAVKPWRATQEFHAENAEPVVETPEHGDQETAAVAQMEKMQNRSSPYRAARRILKRAGNQMTRADGDRINTMEVPKKKSRCIPEKTRKVSTGNFRRLDKGAGRYFQSDGKTVPPLKADGEDSETHQANQGWLLHCWKNSSSKMRADERMSRRKLSYRAVHNEWDWKPLCILP